MKKILIFSALALSVLSVNPIAFADPVDQAIVFTCPSATGSSHLLSRFVNYVGGAGTESVTIDSTVETQNVYFRSAVLSPTANIPGSLVTYSNSGTAFDPISGTVSCSYTSSGSLDPFVVSYVGTNLYGANVTNSQPNSITILEHVGLKN
jgi:hypothetical protein